MLDQTEQEIFMRLSVFRGGFTREAAQQVAGASLQHIGGVSQQIFPEPRSGLWPLGGP